MAKEKDFTKLTGTVRKHLHEKKKELGAAYACLLDGYLGTINTIGSTSDNIKREEQDIHESEAGIRNYQYRIKEAKRHITICEKESQAFLKAKVEFEALLKEKYGIDIENTCKVVNAFKKV